jgi:hypothetical protein
LADGTSLLPFWSRIAGGWFDQAIDRKKILLWRRNEYIAFVVTRHPVNENRNATLAALNVHTKRLLNVAKREVLMPYLGSASSSKRQRTRWN